MSEPTRHTVQPMPDYDTTFLRNALTQWDREFGQGCGNETLRGQVLMAPVVIEMLRSRLAVARAALADSEASR
jgi:hypothetical protein